MTSLRPRGFSLEPQRMTHGLRRPAVRSHDVAQGKDALQGKQRIIEHIRQAFCESERPGAAFLQEGVTKWQKVD